VVIHVEGWGVSIKGTHDGRRDTGDSGSWWDGFEDDAACANFGTFADFDVPEDFGSRADQDSAAHFGVSVTALFACATESDGMEDGDIVFNDGSFTDDEACGMVEEQALAKCCCRVDVHSKSFRDETLQMAGKVLAIFTPEPVGDAVAGDGLKAFEPEKRRENGVASGVAFDDGVQVLTHFVEDCGVVGEGFKEDFLQMAGVARMVAGELYAKACSECLCECPVGEDEVVQQGRQLRLFVGGLSSAAS
jgi:hypothetical protein